MKIASRIRFATCGFVAYLLSLAGFALLGFFAHSAASADSAPTVAALGAAAAVAYTCAAILFVAQVRLSPHRGPGTALLAASTARTEAHELDTVYRDRLAHKNSQHATDRGHIRLAF